MDSHNKIELRKTVGKIKQYMKIDKWILLLFLLCGCYAGYGQEHIFADTLDLQVHFRYGYSIFEPELNENGARLDRFIGRLWELQADTACRIERLTFVGAASPEGNTAMNRRLSARRAENILAHIRTQIELPDSLVSVVSLGIDWEGLTAQVEASQMPYRDEVLDILYHTPEWILRDGKIVDGRKRRLEMLCGGQAWWYMCGQFFPKLRSSDVRVVCRVVQRTEPLVRLEGSDTLALTPREPVVPVPREMPALSDTVRPSGMALPPQKPFYMSLKTNMLYDLLLVPNIGAEFYVGRGWTVGGTWAYAWWSREKSHFYWRLYGGELYVRKYFGRLAAEKPLTGHHLGVHGEIFTYDFELGGRGYIGGKPGGSLWDKMNYAVGVEYGYSLPITRRLNLDFTLGIGYWGGEYKIYDPEDGHYVWKETRQRHWFGPTKAEVSLVWLLGRGNFNKKKGGRR